MFIFIAGTDINNWIYKTEFKWFFKFWNIYCIILLYLCSSI